MSTRRRRSNSRHRRGQKRRNENGVHKKRRPRSGRDVNIERLSQPLESLKKK